MNRKFYKNEKIKSGRPRCPFRSAAAALGNPRYIDHEGTERWTSSGNNTAAKRRWQLARARAAGIEPIVKAAPEVISQKNVENVKRWRLANPQKLQVQRSKGNFIRRSAVRDRTIEPVTVAFLIEQRERQDDRCAYCGTALLGGGHQDHVIPVSRGGAHSPANIVWACEPCNLRKGAKLGWIPFWGRK